MAIQKTKRVCGVQLRRTIAGWMYVTANGTRWVLQKVKGGWQAKCLDRIALQTAKSLDDLMKDLIKTYPVNYRYHDVRVYDYTVAGGLVVMGQ